MTSFKKSCLAEVAVVLGFILGGLTVYAWTMWSTGAAQSAVAEWSDGVITATFDNDTLTFTGDGAIDTTVVWLRPDMVTRHQVRRIVIADGIKSVGDCQLTGDDFPNLEEVVIEADLNSIGYLAFYNNPNLRTVSFVGDCKNIDKTAFKDCYNLGNL